MKKGFWAVLVLLGFLASACGSGRCVCNTFGYKAPEKSQDASVSIEKKTVHQ